MAAYKDIDNSVESSPMLAENSDEEENVTTFESPIWCSGTFTPYTTANPIANAAVQSSKLSSYL